MNSKEKKLAVLDWILFFLSTFTLFLASIILLIAWVTAGLFRQISKSVSKGVLFLRTKPVLTKIVAIFILLFMGLVLYWRFAPLPWKNSEESVFVTIDHGDSMSKVVKKLKQISLIPHEKSFLLISKLLGIDRGIHVGRYDFKKGTTLYEILKKLSSGQVTSFEVTIPEGLNFYGTASILGQKIDMDSTQFVELVKNQEFIKSLNLFDSTLNLEGQNLPPNLEGYLFPDTYHFYWQMDAQKIIRIMVNEFKQHLVDSLKLRAKGQGFSLPQVITLASMIEAEAGNSNERAFISAVYHNRLKLGMLLQCDPTVLYVLPNLNRPLVYKDLEIDSPYNTYLYPGLPPGPICSPGKEAITAALYPADVDYLYFVATGDGSHIFSKNLEAHNKAKREIKNKRFEFSP